MPYIGKCKILTNYNVLWGYAYMCSDWRDDICVDVTQQKCNISKLVPCPRCGSSSVISEFPITSRRTPFRKSRSSAMVLGMTAAAASAWQVQPSSKTWSCTRPNWQKEVGFFGRGPLHSPQDVSEICLLLHNCSCHVICVNSNTNCLYGVFTLLFSCIKGCDKV